MQLKLLQLQLATICFPLKKKKVIKLFGHESIAIDIGITIPNGAYGRNVPCSDLALNHSIDVQGGVIDSGFRGKVCIILFSHSNKAYEVEIGDRNAQFTLEKI